MIEVDTLSKKYAKKTALDGVSFHLRPGETVLLAGPNGAGKTTLLRILAGYIHATSGNAVINGWDIFEDSEKSRASIGYIPENAPLYRDMRVTEYLRFRGKLRGLSRRALRNRTDELVGLCGLGDFRHSPIGGLSRGNRVCVAIADALMHEPPALLLDDPFASLDAERRRSIVLILSRISGDTTILCSTHYPDDAASLFNRMLVLDGGKLVADEKLDPSAGGIQIKATQKIAESRKKETAK